jgi:quinol monooxygenase YgiN
MLILVVRVRIREGHEDAVIEPLRKLQEETRREPGCVDYVVQRSRDDRRVYLIYEQYTDEAALDVHRKSAHFSQYATNGFFPFVEDRKAEFFDPL